MNQRKSLSPLARISDVTASPGIHGATYLLLEIQAMSIIHRHIAKDDPKFVEKLHLGTAPLTMMLTSLCRFAWPQHHAEPPLLSHGQQVLVGVGLGILSIGSLIGIEAACGWITWRGLGWQHYPVPELLRSVVFDAIGHAAIAYNEEMVFRGHGFTVLHHAIGSRRASAILIPLFVLFHDFENPWPAISAYTLSGVNFTMLRQLSGGITLPMAYHWAWNWLQNGIIGAKPDIPSLCPITVNGPPMWTGKLGESSPGWLMVVIQGIVAMLLGWLGGKRWKPEA